jgi:hypothetical protein
MCPQRGLDALRVVDFRRGDSDTGPGARGRRRAPAGRADRQVGILVSGTIQPPPALFPFDHVSAAGAHVCGQHGKPGQPRPCLCFLQQVAGEVGPGSELLVVERRAIPKRAEFGKEPCLAVALANRRH